MKIDCPDCKGSGEVQCCECGNNRDCRRCDGDGEIEGCISTMPIPEKHENRDQLLALKADADKCKEQHTRLCQLNPKAKGSYDAQLETALTEINCKASALL